MPEGKVQQTSCTKWLAQINHRMDSPDPSKSQSTVGAVLNIKTRSPAGQNSTFSIIHKRKHIYWH